MSHLYELFGKQVARFCADSSRPDCNKNLLVAGIRNLAGMDDNVLDKLDPYQRGAKDMSKQQALSPTESAFAEEVGRCICTRSRGKKRRDRRS